MVLHLMTPIKVLTETIITKDELKNGIALGDVLMNK